MPLGERLAAGATWRAVHTWLADLVDELHARREAGQPSEHLTAGHLLVADDGHLVVLPFATGDGADMPAGGVLPQVSTLLRGGIADAVRIEWPLRAQRVLTLLADPATTLDTMGSALSEAGAVREPVTARRRAMLAAATLAPIVLIGAVSAYASRAVIPRDPEVDRLRPLAAWMLDVASTRPEARAERELVAAYIAGHLRGAVERHRRGADSLLQASSSMGKRQWAVADSVVRVRSSVSPDELARADALVDGAWGGTPPGVPSTALLLPVATFAGLLYAGVVFALIAACTVRRGFVLRLFGVELVATDGTPAGRLRLTWRQLLAWAPMLLVAAASLFTLFPTRSVPWARPTLAVSGALLLVTVVLALRSPARGLAERLSGTRMVPE